MHLTRAELALYEQGLLREFDGPDEDDEDDEDDVASTYDMVGALVMDRRRTAEACDVLTQLADSLPAGLTKLLGISHMSDAMTVQEDLIVECLWRRAGTSDGLRDALRSLAIQPRTELGLRISGRQRSSDAIDT